MPKPKQDDTVPGQIEPSFTWETSIPHTVTLMLKSTEEDLILKACQSLYTFARENDLHQTLLVQYNVLTLLLDHLEHPNKNVRHTSAMVLTELSNNNSVQSALVAPENVALLVRVLRDDDDCVVDRMASGALLRLCSDAPGRLLLLHANGVDALVKRLASYHPDVLKNCLDALLSVLDGADAVDALVESDGVAGALQLLDSEFPTLQTLALVVLRKVTTSPRGRHAVHDAGGLQRLLVMLETADLGDLHLAAVAALDGALADPDNIASLDEVDGLRRLLAFVQTTRAPTVLERCSFVLAHVAQQAHVRDTLHELSAEPVLVDSLLACGQPGVQSGAARAVGHMCRKLESQEALVRLAVVPRLLDMLAGSETFQAAAAALAVATRNHQLACRQLVASGHLRLLVGRLATLDDEVVAHAALVLCNVCEHETLRPAVAAAGAAGRLVSCLVGDDSACLVAACRALALLCRHPAARHRVVLHDGSGRLMRLLHHEDPTVRDACLRTMQAIGSDPTAAEQLTSGGVIGSLRALRATSTLRVIMEANLSAMYSIFGRLGARHRLHDLFFDCGRQVTCTSVPALDALLAHPLSATRLVYLVDSGLCPYTGDEELDRPVVEQGEAVGQAGQATPDQASGVACPDEASGQVGQLEAEAGPEANSGKPLDEKPPLSSGGEKPAEQAAAEKPAAGSHRKPCSEELDGQHRAGQPTVSWQTRTPGASNQTDSTGGDKPPRQSSTSQPEGEEGDGADTSKCRHTSDASSDNANADNPAAMPPTEKRPDQSPAAASAAPPATTPQHAAESAAPPSAPANAKQPPGGSSCAPAVRRPPPDAQLAAYVEHARQLARREPRDRDRCAALAAFVAARLGGAVARDQLGAWSCQTHLCQLKRRGRTNVVRVGDVRRAGLRCRALLFKFLADQATLPCTLNRGGGGRHWNTVLLRGEGALPRLEPHLDTVVDLMHQPGRLMPADSADALEYTRGLGSG